MLCYVVQLKGLFSAADSRSTIDWLLPAASKCVFIFQGLALIDAGEAMRELAEVKDALDMEVKQNFIDPLQNLHEKDLKEIQVQSADCLSYRQW